MPPPRLDAATLAQVKAALEDMTPRPWLKGFGSTVGTIIASNPPPPKKAGAVARTFNRELDADGIIALVNAAPALVAGCETLLRVEALMRDLMREARRLRDAGVEDDTNDRWIAAGERENLACRLRDLLAALDAARAEEGR